MSDYISRINAHESLLMAIILDNDPCDRHYSPMDEYHLLQVAYSLGISLTDVLREVRRILDEPNTDLACQRLGIVFETLRDAQSRMV